MISSNKAILFGISILLGSCGGGSDGGASDPGQSQDDPVEFTAPSDAASLRTALTTGASAMDDDEFWQCALENSDLILAYRLFADGSGTETDLANPNVIDQFTWQTMSATTMTTTLMSGAENSFTDIQFAGGDSMSLVFTESISLTCDRQTPEPGTPPTDPGVPVRPNSLSYGGVIYSLTHGFEEVFFYSPEQIGSTHRSGPWQLADAEFQSSSIDGELTGLVFFWDPVGASVQLQATLRSPGGDGFNSATFNFAADSLDSNDPSFDGRFVFQDGFVGVDLNEDGSISGDDNEFHDITGGTISVERLGGISAEMSFNVTLENGVSVVGSFQGDFPVFEHF